MEVENNIIVVYSNPEESSVYEVVERKGIGHPDTLADGLAEELSRVYSNYTLSKFGAILHHNFDKVGLLGGEAYVRFGEGYLTKPIRVLLNGRASTCFGGAKIPVKEMLEKTAIDFLMEHIPLLEREKNITINYNLSNTSSPGKVNKKSSREGTRKYWFEPRGLHDLRELKQLDSNDTSIGCAYAPLTPTETIVLWLENYLNSPDYKNTKPWLGTDIKVIAFRYDNNLDITICLPQIAKHVPDIESYRHNLEVGREDILRFINELYPSFDTFVHINTRDDFESVELYLTATGCSIESGDEGLAGRGNRVNGLITPCRPMSIEGACGKNPVYHVGKLYNITAQRIANRLHKTTNGRVNVYIISQSGRSLKDPWKTLVTLDQNSPSYDEIIKLVQEEFERISSIKDSLLKGEINLF